MYQCFCRSLPFPGRRIAGDCYRGRGGENQPRLRDGRLCYPGGGSNWWPDQGRGRQTWPWVGPRPRTCGHLDRSAGDHLDRRGDCLDRRPSWQKQAPWQKKACQAIILTGASSLTRYHLDRRPSPYKEITLTAEHYERRSTWKDITLTWDHLDQSQFQTSKIHLRRSWRGLKWFDNNVKKTITLKHVWNCSYSRYKVIFKISSVLY